VNTHDWEDPADAALLEQAESACRGRDWQAALGRFQQLLQRRLARSQPLTAGDRVVLERTADLSAALGRTADADRLLGRLADEYRSAGRPFTADCATLKRVQLAYFLADLDGMRNRLDSLHVPSRDLDRQSPGADGMRRWEADCSWPDQPREQYAIVFGRLYLGLGNWHAAQGSYERATALLRRGVEHAQAPNVPQARRPLRSLQQALAQALLEAGRLTEAEDVLRPLRPATGEALDPAEQVQWLQLSGQLDLMRGRFGSAQDHFAAATRLCAGAGLTQASLATALHQAEVQILLNQITEAEQLLAHVKAQAERLRLPQVLRRARDLGDLARARSVASRGGAEPAVAAMWAADSDAAPLPSAGPAPAAPAPEAEHADPPLPPRPASFLGWFEQQALAVQGALSRCQSRAAARRYLDLQRACGGSDSRLIPVRLSVLAALLAYDRQDYAAAADRLRGACPELEALGLWPELLQALRVLGWCATRLGVPTVERAAIQADTQAVLEQLAASLPAAARAVYLLNKPTAEDEDLLAEVRQLEEDCSRLEQGSWLLRPWRRWRLWRRHLALLFRLDAGRRLLREGTGPTADRSPSLLRWLWRQPRRQALVSLLVLPDRVFVSRVAGWHLDFRVAAVTRVRLRSLVARWHQGVRRAEPTAALDRAGEVLADELQLAPLLADPPRRVDRLAFVPDGVLHGLPFAALRLGGRYLGERFAVSIGFEHTGSARRPRPPAAREALAVGVTRAVPATAGFPFHGPALPWTRSEAEEVAAWFRQRGLASHCLVDDDADRGAVLQHWARARLVHIACHGLPNLEQPEESGLVLMPRPGAPEVLRLRDLAGLKLASLEHVTLSNCWSADHHVLAHRWVVSLPEALWRAGAGSVLGSLWPIDDEVGRAFSRRFYEHLANLPRAQALQATQEDCRRGRLPVATGLDVRHVFSWAGYHLYGDAERLPV
jgi:CHAT domain-containing protein